MRNWCNWLNVRRSAKALFVLACLRSGNLGAERRSYVSTISQRHFSLPARNIKEGSSGSTVTMHTSSRPACLFLLISTQVACLPPPLSSSANNDIILPSLLNLTSPATRCDHWSYGSDLQHTSCQNAWQKIGRSKTEITFRIRNGIFSDDELLPFRYLSDDGLCAIDLNFQYEYQKVGTLDWFSVSEQAAAVLVGCVYKSQEGGSVWFLSSSGRKLLNPPYQACSRILCCIHKATSSTHKSRLPLSSKLFLCTIVVGCQIR